MGGAWIDKVSGATMMRDISHETFFGGGAVSITPMEQGCRTRRESVLANALAVGLAGAKQGRHVPHGRRCDMVTETMGHLEKQSRMVVVR